MDLKSSMTTYPNGYQYVGVCMPFYIAKSSAEVNKAGPNCEIYDRESADKKTSSHF